MFLIALLENLGHRVPSSYAFTELKNIKIKCNEHEKDMIHFLTLINITTPQ